MDEKLILKITESTLRLVDHTITPEEFEELDSILSVNPDAARHYNYIMVMIGNFQERGKEIVPDEMTIENVLKEAFWQEMSEYEKTAPEIRIAHEKPQWELIEKVVYPAREKRKISKFSIFMLFNAAAVILFLVLIRFMPPKGGYEVATLVDSIDARWTGKTSSLQTGSRLVAGRDELTLDKGVVKLLFDNGAKTLIEAPAEFKLISENHVELLYGRLYSKVPPEAIGFEVTTLSAQVVDLGTEFGVEVDYKGDTSLLVTKGKISLVVGDKANQAGIEVSAGSAKRVSAETKAVSDVPCDKDLFVRDIDSSNHLIWRSEVAQWNGYIEWTAGSGNWDNGSNWNAGIKPDSTWSIKLRKNSSVCTLKTREVPISNNLEVYNGQTLNVENGGYMGCGWSRFGWSTVNLIGNGTWVLNDENLIIGCENKKDGPCVWTMSDTSKIDTVRGFGDREILCIAENDGVGVLKLIGSGVTINCGQLYMGRVRKPVYAPSSTLEFVMDANGASTIHVGSRVYLSEGAATSHLVLSAPESLPQSDIVLVEILRDNTTIRGEGQFDTMNDGPAVEGTPIILGGNRYTLTYHHEANGDGCHNDIALVFQNNMP